MDIELDTVLTPQQRLQATREALARQMNRRRRAPLPRDPGLAAQQGMAGRVRRAARVWWHTHPMHDAVDVARPALQDYAQHKPYKLVGIAAGAGAALTLLGAWHILPLTGVALALMKSSDLGATARSFMKVPPGIHPREEEDMHARMAVAHAAARQAPREGSASLVQPAGPRSSALQQP